MNDADLVEVGAHIDSALASIARIVAAREGSKPEGPDTHIIAAIAALTMLVNSMFRAEGARGIKLAVHAMASLEADYWNEVQMRMPRSPFDKVN